MLAAARPSEKSNEGEAPADQKVQAGRRHKACIIGPYIMSASAIAAARLERSERRAGGLPILEATIGGPERISEVQILRAEVAESDASILQLQSQLKQSEAEMAEMGSRTARMQDELRQMRALADAQLGPQPIAGAPAPAAVAAAAAKMPDAPLTVSIDVPTEANGDDFTVRISIGLDSPIKEATMIS